jgi:predicted DNA-binding ribbon-helix-helix protein
MNEQPQHAELPQAQNKQQRPSSALVSKNIRIHDRRTSVRLEPEMWNALQEISAIEKCSVHDLCGAVHDLKETGSSFTAALRVFLMEYYRTAAKTSQSVSQVQKLLKHPAVPEMQKATA